MSILQTPPEREPDQQSEPGTERAPLPSRYREMEHHELIYLLDEVDDERARARFREAVYVSFIVWLLLLLLIVYGPVYLWHSPRLIAVNPEQHHPNMTYLDLPKNIAKKIPRQTPNVAERNQQSQSPQPAPAPVMPKQGQPAPQTSQAPPQPTPPQQQQATQPAPPQPTQRPSPVQSRPQPPLIDSPTPAPSKPNFNTGAGSAGSQIAQAARGARNSTGESGEYGNGPQRSGGAAMGTQILSDTQGVDFAKYLARLLADIKRNWLPLIPEECRPPLNKQGITGVRFTIGRDGSIQQMNLDYSTHDDAINRAAWGSIKALGSAQPLPPEFHGPNLELRVEFRINKDPQ